jgi:hypothetical protein
LNLKKYSFFSSCVRSARCIDCSQRQTHGSSVYFTNSSDCCSILEKLDFSRSPIMCGGNAEDSRNLINLELPSLKELCLFR